MKLNLTLKQTGWLFLTVSLAFELFFVGTMFVLSREAELDAQRYEHRVDVTNKSVLMLISLYKGGYYLAFYTMSHKDEYGKAYDEISLQVPRELDQISSMSQTKEERDAISHLCVLIADTISKFNRYKAHVDESGDLSLVPLRKELLPCLAGLLVELQNFSDEKDDATQMAEQQRAKRRLYMQIALGSGVLMSIVLAVWFMSWYTRAITGKLHVLTENTVRLASNEPLMPQLEGDDEISQLDGVFHYMATELEKASQKQREANEVLRASEERVRLIIENMPVGLIALHKDGRIFSVNPRTEEMFNYKQSELSDKNVVSLFSGPLTQDPSTFMGMINRTASRKSQELSAVRNGGASFPVEISFNEFNTKDGALLLLNIQDVTQRHELERIKREFVAMVSHDLRTPLTSVQGSLTLLSAGALGPLSAEAESVVNTAESEIARLKGLVSDLLDVARIEAGKMEVTQKQAQLSTILRRSAAAVTSFAEQHQVAIACADSPAMVYADPERLIQVVVNLLFNAIKFSPPNSTVSITTEIADKFLEVQVSDHGRGIPPEHQEAIFQRFHQVESTDATVKQGTGLGLPICKTIIEQHGGTIGVESEVGKGSTFWFRIPMFAASSSDNNMEEKSADRAGMA